MPRSWFFVSQVVTVVVARTVVAATVVEVRTAVEVMVSHAKRARRPVDLSFFCLETSCRCAQVG